MKLSLAGLLELLEERFKVQGLRVGGSGFRVHGSRFKVQGLERGEGKDEG
jgi:hypothetical protein